MPLVNKTFSDIITFTRASTATYFDSAGVLQSAAIDTPRFDYDPATLAARGLLIEEQRTNFMLQSQDFTTTWSPTLTSVTADALTSPDGTVDADKVVINSGATIINSYVQQNLTKSAVAITYTFSVFAKIGEYNRITLVASGSTTTVTDRSLAGWSLSDGSVTTAASSAGTFTNASASAGTPVGNGWYRFSLTFTTGTETTLANRVAIRDSVATTGDGTSGAYIWGAQLEAGAFPTSYIPTTTTALTRSADVASVNTLSPWFNATEGTLYAEASPQASNVASFTLIDFNNATAANRISLSKAITSGNASLFVNNTNTPQCNISSAAWTATGKLAGAYKVDDFATSYNGATPATDTTGTVPSVTRMQIGVRADGGNQLTGYIRRITYYPRKLSSAELQTLTA